MEKAPILVTTFAALFEIDYKLPALTGSERQIAWGRNIRAKWLQRAFNQIVEAPINKDLYSTLDDVRNMTFASRWIDLRLYDTEERQPMDYLRVIVKCRKDEQEKATVNIDDYLG
jgi:hypothetical protein